MADKKQILKRRKGFEIKTADLQENTLSGDASVMGVLDLGGDLIFPGAFKSVLSKFIADGFIALGHNWKELPIAMPISAKEVGNTLKTVAEFHTTQSAQDARTVASERLAKGKSVGLSVAFITEPDGYQYFENGGKLLQFGKDNGHDMSLFDAKSIKAYDTWCTGIFDIQRLIEYSVTPIPMNPLAVADSVKSLLGDGVDEIETERDFERFLRDAGFSRKDAAALTLHGFKALQRDAGPDDPPAENAPLTPDRSALTFRSLCARTAAIQALVS